MQKTRTIETTTVFLITFLELFLKNDSTVYFLNIEILSGKAIKPI